MPGQFLTDAQKENLNSLPDNIPYEDLVKSFTLSCYDLEQIPQKSAPYNRLGFAMQTCILRYLGFCPDKIAPYNHEATIYIAKQLSIEPKELKKYGKRNHTRTDHLSKIATYLGFQKANDKNIARIYEWLIQRALEHNRSILLLQMLCERLLNKKIIRPGITFLERLVVDAKQKTNWITFQHVSHILTEENKLFLDNLLQFDENLGKFPLTWLRKSANSNSPAEILSSIEKLNWLKNKSIHHWDISIINPNRIKYLTQIARKSRAQGIFRMNEEKRYPILICFVYQSLIDIIDEIIEMFDGCLFKAYTRSKHDFDAFRLRIANQTNEKVCLLRDISSIILDEDVSNNDLREKIFNKVPQERLREVLKECIEIIRPSNDHYFDFLETRYCYIRQFSPKLLDSLEFKTGVREKEELILAIELLKSLNKENKRVVPGFAPLSFVSPKWEEYVIGINGRINRHFYELCVLWELRSSLRSGDIWLDKSRRYAKLENYFIPKNKWLEKKEDVCSQIHLCVDGNQRLDEKYSILNEIIQRVDNSLPNNNSVRIENNDLIISPLSAEHKPLSAIELEVLVDKRLPQVELSELIIEVDNWTNFTNNFEHAGGKEPKSEDFLKYIYASLIEEASNLGMYRMARISDLSYDNLVWFSNWYLREETIKNAVNCIVNYQYHQPLSSFWGGGTLSSSDGQRFPVSGKVRNATSIPKYFGYGKGVTFYTWTSDQYSQYGTKVISSTIRDATYVLDEILDNETELKILEHMTDTAGYTYIIFALFDLLGMQFSPRIKDIGEQKLYKTDSHKTYPNIEPLLKGKIKRQLILDHWEDIIWMIGSFKLGWVTTSLFISKLQSYPKQNKLTQALQEYGKLIKTIFILRYIEDENYRRKIQLQLNKGEALHALRRFTFFGNEGKIKRKQEEEQINQAGCLNLVTNAVVTWNTVYISAIIDQLRLEGYKVNDEDLKYLSPSRYEHINPYGRYNFDIEKELSRKCLRPLRKA